MNARINFSRWRLLLDYKRQCESSLEGYTSSLSTELAKVKHCMKSTSEKVSQRIMVREMKSRKRLPSLVINSSLSRRILSNKKNVPQTLFLLQFFADLSWWSRLRDMVSRKWLLRNRRQTSLVLQAFRFLYLSSSTFIFQRISSKTSIVSSLERLSKKRVEYNRVCHEHPSCLRKKSQSNQIKEGTFRGWNKFMVFASFCLNLMDSPSWSRDLWFRSFSAAYDVVMFMPPSLILQLNRSMEGNLFKNYD